MAMEKLVAVKDDRYDLVILDTRPTANALDFSTPRATHGGRSTRRP